MIAGVALVLLVLPAAIALRLLGSSMESVGAVFTFLAAVLFGVKLIAMAWATVGRLAARLAGTVATAD